MKRLGAFLSAMAIVAMCGLTASSQPPEGKEKKGPFGKDKGFPKFQVGTVIPPHLRGELSLTPDQEAKLAELEKDVRDRLNKILTDEQRRKIEEGRPPMGGFGKGEGGKGDFPPGKKGPPEGPGGKGEFPPGKKGPGGKGDGLPPRKDGELTQANGIQWFATWEFGLAEAKRTGRPMLFLSAAPHCAGVSGIW